MNPQDWTVLACTGAKEWSGKHGDFIDYYITLDGYADSVTLTQKPDTAAPGPGFNLYGHIETQQLTKRDGEAFTKHKFKKDQREDGSVPPPRTSTAGSANGSTVGGGLRYDEQSAIRSLRIERQHSQEMALRFLSAFEPKIEGHTAKTYAGLVKEWTDNFCEDLDDYVKAQPLRGYKAQQDADAEQVPAIKEPSASRYAHVKPEKSLEDAVLDGDIGSADDDLPF